MFGNSRNLKCVKGSIRYGIYPLDVLEKVCHCGDVKMTGLPFVFAVWVAKSKVQAEFSEKCSKAFRLGIDRISVIVENHAIQEFNLFDYFTKNISYTLDTGKKEGLISFLSYIGEMQQMKLSSDHTIVK